MKSKTLGLLAVGLLAGPVVSVAEIIVDTGPGPSTLSGPLISSGVGIFSQQRLAGQFVLADQYEITSVEVWMWNLAARFAVRGDQFTAVIYSDNEGLPGDELYSAQFVAGNLTPEWRGPAGLSWKLPAGTYWAAFESRPGQVGVGSAPTPAAQPLQKTAFASVVTGNAWYGEGLPTDHGTRITGERGPAVILDELTNAVTGVGPGKSLANQIGAVTAQYQAGAIEPACAALDGFVGHVNGLKKSGRLDPIEADALLSDANDLAATMGCP